jgi:hypothetical protein
LILDGSLAFCIVRQNPLFVMFTKERVEPITDVHGVPGGSWAERQPSYSRTVKALFKKQFLLKFRSWSSIIEILIALTFYLLLYPID